MKPREDATVNAALKGRTGAKRASFVKRHPLGAGFIQCIVNRSILEGIAVGITIRDTLQDANDGVVVVAQMNSTRQRLRFSTSN